MGRPTPTTIYLIQFHPEHSGEWWKKREEQKSPPEPDDRES